MADSDDRTSFETSNADALLAIYLIDVRAEIEANLRILTDTQRQLERFRAMRGPGRGQTKGLLGRQLKQMLATNVSIREGLLEAERAITVLPEV